MNTAPRVADTVSHLIHVADYRFNRENSRVLERYGVTTYQAMSLIYVADHEKHRTVNQRALERYTQLSNPGVTKLVTGLEKLGLLERAHDPEDARSYALHTTAKGRELCETLRQAILESDRALTEKLSGDEAEQLCALLKKMCG